MRIAVRFRYYKAVTPSMEIVDLTDQQWRDFLLAKPEERQRLMAWFINKEDRDVRELWWIPLDDQSALTITSDTKIIKVRSNKGVSTK